MRQINKTLRRLENSDRQRLIKSHIVHPHDDDLEARKRIERQWERGLDLVEHSTPEDREIGGKGRCVSQMMSTKL